MRRDRRFAWCATAHASSLPPRGLDLGSSVHGNEDRQVVALRVDEPPKGLFSVGATYPHPKEGGASSAAAMVMISLVTWYMGAAKSAAASFGPTGRVAAVMPFSVTLPSGGGLRKSKWTRSSIPRASMVRAVSVKSVRMISGSSRTGMLRKCSSV